MATTIIADTRLFGSLVSRVEIVEFDENLAPADVPYERAADIATILASAEPSEYPGLTPDEQTVVDHLLPGWTVSQLYAHRYRNEPIITREIFRLPIGRGIIPHIERGVLVAHPRENRLLTETEHAAIHANSFAEWLDTLEITDEPVSGRWSEWSRRWFVEPSEKTILAIL